MANPFSFYFNPQKLQKATESIAAKYKHADQVPPYLINKKLPDLLEQIDRLENSHDILMTFAKRLTKVDINILTSEYPYQRENEILLEKVSFILRARYKTLIGKRFWSHFQLLPNDMRVQSLLALAFQVEDEHFLALKKEIRETCNTIFHDKNALYNMAVSIGKSGMNVKDALQEWRVQESSRLEEALWVLVLYSFIKFESFIEAQDVYEIEIQLENMKIEQYKKIIFRYLDAFDFKNYHSRFVKQAVLRLEDPRKTTNQWDEAPENVITKVQKWLYQSELFEFLDGERFDYWKRYIRDIKNLHVLQRPPVAAMYFDGFVVVEFKNSGNAAYFYKEEGFKRHILPRMETGIPENDLKDKYSSFYINNLTHHRSGGIPRWYDSFTEKIDHYMKRYKE